MGLDKLEVENFKSYAGHHTIGPFDKFTCVIGPNGSGKSNIMDAIAFALGFTSSSLRSSSATNLINNGKTHASVKLFIDTHTFRRHITSTGRSTYFFDSRIVPYEAYSKELEGVNINLKLRNFLVFQGDIHEMANKTPKELCEYFEVLSGSIRFKEEYDKAQESLNKDLAECGVLYEQKKNMLAVMKEEKEEEKQLEVLKECLREKSRLEKDILNLEIREIRVKLSQTIGDLQSFGECQEKFREEIREKEVQVIQKKEVVSKLRGEYSSLEEELQRLRIQKMSQIREMTAFYKAKDKSNIRKKEVDDLIEENSKKLEMAKRALGSEKECLKMLEEAYSRKVEETVVNFTREQEEKYLKETEAIREELKALREEAKQEEKKLREFKKKKSEMDLKREKKKVLSRGVEVLSKNIAGLYEKMGEDLKIYATLEKEEKEKTKKLYEVVGDLLKIRATKKINLKKETIRSVVHTLKSIFPGVHGILVDLLKPTQKKFYSPLLTLLQPFDYGVVVDSDTTAMTCISYIKEKKLCKLVFIPLKGLKQNFNKEFEKDLSNPPIYSEGDFRSAFTCVSYEEKYREVIRFVLQDSIITDTKEKALELVYKKGFTCNVCSLDNFFIRSKGRIISTSRRGLGEGEEEFGRLVEERKRLLREIKEIQDKKERMSKIEIVKERIKVYEEKIAKDRKEINEIDSEEVCVVEQETRNVNPLIHRLEATLKAKEREVFGDIFRDSSYEDFTERGKALEYQKIKRKMESRIQEMEGEIEDLETQREDLVREKGAIDTKTKEMSPEIDAEIRKYDFLLEKKKIELDASLKHFEEVNEEFKEMVKRKKKMDTTYLTLELNKNKLEEEIEEKIRFGELEEIEIEEDDKEGHNSEAYKERDISKDKVVHAPSQPTTTTTYPTTTYQSLDSLRHSLSSLNLKISEMVPAVKHNKKNFNYNKINADYEEAKKKAMETRKKMNEIRRERTTTFMTCFEVVSGGIGKIYQEISRSEESRGNAYLVLDNPNEPYLEGVKYHVMPPTKRFREIGYLSGGEKSMAILALMFSINTYKPVPFFILDEFDSALDNTNVGRMVDFFVKCDVQFLVISLKPILFQYADSLVGVYQDPSEKTSKILTYRM